MSAAFHRRLEAVLEYVYAADWPAHVWGLWPPASRVQRLEYEMAAPGGRGARPPLRVAFLSDIHIGPTTPSSLLDAAFAEVRAMRADAVVLGGDYVYLAANEKRMAELRDRVASLDVPTKVCLLYTSDAADE